jgi:NAD(P)H-hydrate epimerase
MTGPDHHPPGPDPRGRPASARDPLGEEEIAAPDGAGTGSAPLFPPSHGAPTGADGGGTDAIFVFTREGVRAVDRAASEEHGVPEVVLMENAARHLADVCLDLLEEVTSPKILMFCGPGNNGGDGLAAARHLHNAGATVCVLVLPAREASGGAAGAAGVNLGIVRRMGLPLIEIDPGAPDTGVREGIRRLGRPDLIVDALLGTGLDRQVREPVLSLIRAINALRSSPGGAAVVAVDIPSGMDCDTGEALGATVQADVTVSFVGIKTGFLTLGAQAYLGDVVVADIGAPRELVERLGRPMAAPSHREGAVSARSVSARARRSGRRAGPAG